MKLLVLSHSVTVHTVGGLETHAENLARAATELGHDVVLLTTAHPHGIRDETRDGVRFEYLEGMPPGQNSRPWWGKSAEATKRWIGRDFRDCLLSLSLSGYGVAASKIEIPHYAVAFGESLAHLSSEWHNCSTFRERVTYPKRAIGVIDAALRERRLWSGVDGVIATYDLLYQKLRRLGYRTLLSYNGIDALQFTSDERLRQETRQALGIETSASVCLMLATVNRQKGVWLGVESFCALAPRFPELHLLVGGDGPDLPRLKKRMSAETWSDRVHFVGSVSPDRIRPVYAASDLFLYPTLRMEGLPFAIIYALASGLPVIASDRGGINSAVKHEENGLLVKPGDLHGLNISVERVLRDAVFARNLSKQAREDALIRFDLRPITARLLQQLQQLQEVRRSW